MRIKFGFICFVLFVISCSSISKIDSAKEIVDEFYGNMNDADYEGMISMLDEKWFEVTDEETTYEFFQKIHNKAGIIEGYTLVTWQVKTLNMVVGEGSGTYYTLKYSVNGTNIDTTDTFTIYNPKGSEEFKIVGYNVNSPELI